MVDRNPYPGATNQLSCHQVGYIAASVDDVDAVPGQNPGHFSALRLIGSPIKLELIIELRLLVVGFLNNFLNNQHEQRLIMK